MTDWERRNALRKKTMRVHVEWGRGFTPEQRAGLADFLSTCIDDPLFFGKLIERDADLSISILGLAAARWGDVLQQIVEEDEAARN